MLSSKTWYVAQQSLRFIIALTIGRSGIVIYGTSSLRLRAREPHYLGPLLGLIKNQLAEVGGRTGNHCAPEVGKSRLHLGVGEACIDLLVEPVNDLGSCVLGCANAKIRARLIARDKTVYGRDIRQRL